MFLRDVLGISFVARRRSNLSSFRMQVSERVVKFVQQSSFRMQVFERVWIPNKLISDFPDIKVLLVYPIIYLQSLVP